MNDLKLFRKDNNLTQIEAAKYFSCTQGFISQIERGERPIPDTFFDKVIADNSIKKTHLTKSTVMDKVSSEELESEMIPTSVFNMIKEERKRSDSQINELLAQQRILIETIKDQAELLKKGDALPENDAKCVAATGLDK